MEAQKKSAWAEWDSIRPDSDSSDWDSFAPVSSDLILKFRSCFAATQKGQESWQEFRAARCRLG